MKNFWWNLIIYRIVNKNTKPQEKFSKREALLSARNEWHEPENEAHSWGTYGTEKEVIKAKNIVLREDPLDLVAM